MVKENLGAKTLMIDRLVINNWICGYVDLLMGNLIILNYPVNNNWQFDNWVIENLVFGRLVTDYLLLANVGNYIFWDDPNVCYSFQCIKEETHNFF